MVLGAAISTFSKLKCNTIETYLDKFESDSSIASAKELWEMARNDNLKITPAMGETINVDFSPNYLDTSQVHLNSSYYDTTDFLMTGVLRRGETLNQKLAHLGTASVYGQKTLKVMEGLGYATQLNPIYPVMELAAELGSSRYNPDSARWVPHTDFLDFDKL